MLVRETGIAGIKGRGIGSTLGFTQHMIVMQNCTLCPGPGVGVPILLFKKLQKLKSTKPYLCASTKFSC